MKPETFRRRGYDALWDLQDLNEAIEGARHLKDRSLYAEMLSTRQEILHYIDSLVEEYMGPEDVTLGAKRVRRWPRKDQSAPSIWTDMEFLIGEYYQHVRHHEEVDPTYSILSVTVPFLRGVATLSQKIRVGKGAILERDPAFWTRDKEEETNKVVEHAKRVLEEHGT